MSVYITILNADLKHKPNKDLFIVVQSEGAVLKTQDSFPSEHPSWQSSIVCKINERSLIFEAKQNGEVKDSTIGKGKLRFNTFEYSPFKQIPYQVTLKNKSNKDVGTLHLNVFYNDKKNYVGQMQFYELGNADTASNIKVVYDVNQITDGKVSKERVMFYKGPCKTKNMFSCCDQKTANQKFQVVEKHYRDDYYK